MSGPRVEVDPGAEAGPGEADVVAGVAVLSVEETGENAAGQDEAEGWDEDDEDDDEDEEDLLVRLGIVEELEIPEAMEPKYFPSKVGGKPAWLVPSPLPPAEDLRCQATPHGETCGRQLAFVLQVYAPLMDGAPESFHRTMYVFCCRNKTCQGKQGSARVFRSQLARKNDFYSFEPPEYPGSSAARITMLAEEVEEPQNAMSDPQVSEALESKKTANDLFTAGKVDEALEGYAKAAQILDGWGKWSKGGAVGMEYAKIRGNMAECYLKKSDPAMAKEQCDLALKGDDKFVKAFFRRAKALVQFSTLGGGAACGALGEARKQLAKALELDDDCQPARDLLKELKPKWLAEPDFRELELTIEEEPDDVEETDKLAEEKKHIQELIEKYNKEDNKELKEDADKFFKDRDEKVGQGTVDPAFLKFKLRTEREPRQGIRYSFDELSAPLWLSSKGQVEKDKVPPCPHCGAERDFEFQIMPQLLYYLEADDKSATPHEMEWGTLAVYSCPDSCVTKASYAEEFLWVQPVPS